MGDKDASKKRDDILKRMLDTKPKPSKAKVGPKRKKRKGSKKKPKQ